MTDDVFAPPRSNVEVREGPEALWELSWKEVRKIYYASLNIRALGVLYGLGAFGGLAGTVIFFSATITTQAGTRGMPPWLGVASVVLGVVYVAACWTSFTRPTWGRWLGLTLCVLGLLSVPIGTLIGIWGIAAYVQGGKLFGPERFLHQDVAVVFKQRKADRK